MLLNGALVLVVDDNLAFRGLARRILTSWGHDVIEAASVAEALARAAELRPEIVLADIGLPDGDGFSLTEQLLELPWRMRVVLISTDSDAGNGFAAERAGACGFFPKDELLSTELQQLIGHH
jgi:CheY-like chemotaxis protein